MAALHLPATALRPGSLSRNSTLTEVLARAATDGLFCSRVNATGTDIWPEHEVTEHDPDGGFTVCYLAGAKEGLRRCSP